MVGKTFLLSDPAELVLLHATWAIAKITIPYDVDSCGKS